MRIPCCLVGVGLLVACGDPAPPTNDDDANDAVTLTITVDGSGVVQSQPAGIDCRDTTCTAQFPRGTAIVLTARGVRATHTGWTADCAGARSTCTLTVTADSAITATFEPLACNAADICWESPRPFGSDLNEVFAVSASDVWAVGRHGTIAHFDGVEWSLVASNTTNDLLSVWARNATDVWVAAGLSDVTGNGVLLHYDGLIWSPVDTGIAGRATTAVFGTEASNLFVATNTPFVLHSATNGASWTPVDTTALASTRLSGITGTSSSDIWVWADGGMIAHWNGSAYAVESTSFILGGLWQARENEVLVVDQVGAVSHYFGSTFLSEGAVATNVGNGFQTLFGISSTDLFTSGQLGKLYHFDGTLWTPFQTSATDVGTYAGIHGTTSGDVWAVGRRGAIAHWDGGAATVDRQNAFSTFMFDAWGTVDDLWFLTTDSTVVHWDGGSYVESEPLVAPRGVLTDIHGTAPNDIWLVGMMDELFSVILHYDGTAWTPSPVDPAFSFPAKLVWAAGPTDAWAVPASLSQGILHWNGTMWTIDTSLAGPGFPRALWGTGANDVWLSAGTQLAHYTGTWNMDRSFDELVTAFGGTSPTDVWAGANGAVYHYDGSWGERISIPGAGAIIGIAAVAPDDVWFSDGESVFHWRGTTFDRVDTTFAGDNNGGRAPYQVLGIDRGDVWFAGSGILRYRPR